MAQPKYASAEKISAHGISEDLRASWQRRSGNYRTHLSSTHKKYPKYINGKQQHRYDAYW